MLMRPDRLRPVEPLVDGQQEHAAGERGPPPCFLLRTAVTVSDRRMGYGEKRVEVVKEKISWDTS